MVKLRKRVMIFAAVILFSSLTLAYAQGRKDGIILLHGKGPSQKYIMVLAEALRSNGFLVATPSMPYGMLNWEKSYEENLAVVEGEVRDLKKQAVNRLFLAGHSMGANFALYAATKIPFEGVIVVGPGHIPEDKDFAERIKSDVSRAKAMVAEGKGNEVSVFDDYNQGRRLIRKTTARIYLSYEDPAGPAVMPRNAQALLPKTSLLWVVGTQDPMSNRGQEYAFRKAPPNPRNEYLTVEGNHLNTPSEAGPAIVKWLKKFDQEVQAVPGPKK